MSRIHANNFSTTINGAIDDNDLSVVLSDVTGFPSIGAGVTCNLTLQNGATIEIITATARSSNTLTITRGSESTTPVAWADGSVISIRPTADSVDRKLDISDAVETAQDAVGAMVDTTIVYTDGTPLLSRAALTGDVTASAGSNATTIATPSSATVATDDKVLIKDTSASDATKYVTAQSIRDLSTTSETATSKITVGGNSTAAGFIELLEDSDNGSNKLTITGQQSMASDKTVTFQDVTGIVYVTGGTDVAIADGGTGVSSVTTSPTASAFAGWDANSNLSSNNFLTGYTSTATAAGTTTLTVASTQTRIFTGTTTQNCDMPAVSTLALGTTYRITNLSTGVVTVRSSGGNTIQAMQSNSTLILMSNATSGTSASVWYVINYGCAASDQTGSGSLVRATSPTLVTPTLGVASATSINFGQDAFNYYDEGTWTPVATFSTPGDVSVAYTTQTGTYTRMGNVVIITMTLTFTPTFTTAAGSLDVSGLPFTILSTIYGTAINGSGFNYPASRTDIASSFVASGTILRVVGTGSGVSASNLGVTQFTSGVSHTIRASAFYLV
jgi:hypothetical protein